MLSKKLNIGLFLAYLVIVVLAAVIPNPISGVGVNYFLHGVEYFILATLSLRFFKHFKVKKSYLFAIILTLAVVVSLESLQIFLSYRKFNFYDIIAGLVGTLFVCSWRMF